MNLSPPGIDFNYSLSSSSNIVTPERLTPPKQLSQISENFLRADKDVVVEIRIVTKID